MHRTAFWKVDPPKFAMAHIVEISPEPVNKAALIRYAAVCFAAFDFFVVLYEEPTLRRKFGDSYVIYRSSVN
jgi:hypothetical protein